MTNVHHLIVTCLSLQRPPIANVINFWHKILADHAFPHMNSWIHTRLLSQPSHVCHDWNFLSVKFFGCVNFQNVITKYDSEGDTAGCRFCKGQVKALQDWIKSLPTKEAIEKRLNDFCNHVELTAFKQEVKISFFIRFSRFFIWKPWSDKCCLRLSVWWWEVNRRHYFHTLSDEFHLCL